MKQPNPQAVKSYLAPKMPDYLAMLRQMVDINSFSANPDGVNALGQLTAEAFAPLGFSAQTVQAANPQFGRHLVLTRPGRTDTTIGLVSHLDTVFPPEEEQANDFGWQEAGNIIYGPGTVDIKGGTVMIFMVLDALRALAPAAFEAVTWKVLLNAAEERLSPDFGDLVLRELGKDAKACLVFEGGKMDGNDFALAVTRKGKAAYRVGVTGRSAHAGNNHHQGANAIVQLAYTIQQIAALTDYRRRLTYNVGTVTGGSVTNRVPHTAEAAVEMRAFDPDVFEQGIVDMLALADQATVASVDDGFPCTVKIDLLEKTFPWPDNPKTNGLFAVWEQAAGAMGLTLLREHRGGLSDGNHTWHTIPTIDGLGPSGGNAHCSERSDDGSKEPEYVYVPSFLPKATLNTLAILKLIAM